MSIEAIAASGVQAPGPKIVELAPPVPQTPSPELAGRFRAALDQAAAVDDVPPALRGLLETLDKVNIEARGVTEYARTAELSGGEMTPGEIVQLTMRCQEFMFHCQLTSNIANRSSDGIQQLFRQQS